MKILILDIETSPLITYSWGLNDQFLTLDQLVEDWHLLSYSAKFIGENKVYYGDQRHAKNIKDDKKLLKEIWKLMDESDVIIGQNSTSFDIKKLNARFIMNDMKPPSSYKQFDTLKMAKKHFGFTSNKLEHLSRSICKKHKKSKHKKFSGLSLWKECLKGNKEAWKEMEHYNVRDVLATEELFNALAPWDSGVDFNVFHDSEDNICSCGSKNFNKKGFSYTSSGKYQRYVCASCGKNRRGATNLFSKEKKKSLRQKV